MRTLEIQVLHFAGCPCVPALVQQLVDVRGGVFYPLPRGPHGESPAAIGVRSRSPRGRACTEPRSAPLAAVHMRVAPTVYRWRVVAVHADEMVAGQRRGVLPISSAAAAPLSIIAQLDPETSRGSADCLRACGLTCSSTLARLNRPYAPIRRPCSRGHERLIAGIPRLEPGGRSDGTSETPAVQGREGGIFRCNPVSVFLGNGVVVAWWEFCRRGRHVCPSAALPVSGTLHYVLRVLHDVIPVLHARCLGRG